MKGRAAAVAARRRNRCGRAARRALLHSRRRQTTQRGLLYRPRLAQFRRRREVNGLSPRSAQAAKSRSSRRSKKRSSISKRSPRSRRARRRTDQVVQYAAVPLIPRIFRELLGPVGMGAPSRSPCSGRRRRSVTPLDLPLDHLKTTSSRLPVLPETGSGRGRRSPRRRAAVCGARFGLLVSRRTTRVWPALRVRRWRMCALAFRLSTRIAAAFAASTRYNGCVPSLAWPSDPLDPAAPAKHRHTGS